MIALAIVAAFGLAFLAGLHGGRRLLWRQMRGNREFGRACLEDLAKVHHAKLEITEL